MRQPIIIASVRGVSRPRTKPQERVSLSLVDCDVWRAEIQSTLSRRWSAVINGVTAVPLMIVMVLLVRNPKVMGRSTASHGLVFVG